MLLPSSDSYFIKPIFRFYRQLQQALFVRDVYAPMFFCDFINMGIVIAFYSQFGVCHSRKKINLSFEYEHISFLYS